MSTPIRTHAQDELGSPLPVVESSQDSTTNHATCCKRSRFDITKTVESTSAPPCANFKKDLFPQVAVEQFWRGFTTKKPGKPFNLLPGHVRAKRAAIKASIEAESSTNAVVSYDQAAAVCKAEIDSIVRNCCRLNQKYSDLDFDIESDLVRWLRIGLVEDCLQPLTGWHDDLRPRSVKRVEVS